MNGPKRSLRTTVREGLRGLKALGKQAHIDLGGDQRDSIFLAGSGRGGTTGSPR